MMSADMTRARVLVVLVLVVPVVPILVAACGHDRGADARAAKGPPDETAAPLTPVRRAPPGASLDAGAAPDAADRLTDGLRRQTEWFAALPACRVEEVAAAKRAPPAKGSGKRRDVRVRGRLTAAAAQCTMMQCWPAGACCNSCSWSWAVAPLDGKPAAPLRVQRSGAPDALAGAGLDCVMSHWSPPEVVVAGRLAPSGDLVTEAALCRVPGE
jgi:hypothetical protein